MRKLNYQLIESPTPPINTKDVYWVDYNESIKGEVKDIKEYRNGEWVTVLKKSEGTTEEIKEYKERYFKYLDELSNTDLESDGSYLENLVIKFMIASVDYYFDFGNVPLFYMDCQYDGGAFNLKAESFKKSDFKELYTYNNLDSTIIDNFMPEEEIVGNNKPIEGILFLGTVHNRMIFGPTKDLVMLNTDIIRTQSVIYASPFSASLRTGYNDNIDSFIFIGTALVLTSPTTVAPIRLSPSFRDKLDISKFNENIKQLVNY